MVTIREGDETRQMPAIEAILRAQTKSAASGNAYAQKHMIERFMWADRERRAEIEESNAFWREYVAWHREQIAEAERKGEPPPTPLPHPDDIVIDDEKGVRFIGPVDEAWAAKLEETIKLRDLHLIQDVLEVRQAVDLHGPDRPGTALAFAIILNNSLPPRLRLADAEAEAFMRPYEIMPKRQLLKTLYRAWREIGAPRRRGWMYPPRRWGLAGPRRRSSTWRGKS